MKVPLFAAGSYESASLNADCQRSVNLFPEVVESGVGKASPVLYTVPGLRSFLELPDSPVRGLYAFDGRTFAVAGSTFYEVFCRELPLGTPQYPFGPELKAAILAAASAPASGAVEFGYPLMDADHWAFFYTQVTQHPPPPAESYGFSPGGTYGRFEHVTLDQWWALFSDATPHADALGTGLLNDYQPAFMVSNGKQILVLSGGQPYLFYKDYDDRSFVPVYLTTDPPTQGVDLVVDAADNTKVTTVSYSFTADDVGTWLTIKTGAGWTAGEYYISAVSGGAAILDRSPAATGTTGGEWRQHYRTWFTSAAYCDGYFLAVEGLSQKFYISAQYDGYLWSALEFGTAEGSPDNIVAVLADHGEVVMLGSESAELFVDTGNADFPFERVPGGFIQQGCVAPWSAAVLDNRFFWLGGDSRGRGIAWVSEGNIPKRVSTHAVEAKWATYPGLNDAIAFAYQEGGHGFWVINFPTANSTWVYDVTTQQWHERGAWDGSTFTRHRARCHTYAYGKHLVGDYTTGKIFEQSLAIDDFDGEPIHWQRTVPHISDEEYNIFYHRFTLAAETGVRDTTVSLSWSYDRGHNYNTPKDRTAAAGNYSARLIWNRLGDKRDRVFRLTGTGRVVLLNGYIEVTHGTH